MTKFDSVSDVLEEFVPPFDAEDRDWEEILRRAHSDPMRPAPRFGLASRLGVAAAATAIILLAILFWPAVGRQPGVLDRALAAVGKGPVLHVVFEDEFSSTLIDLSTGERREMHGEREAWFDPERGLHEISRFSGVVQSEALFGPRELPRFAAKTFALLGADYREALESGRARNLGPGEAHGEPVYWIRVDAESLPDSADGKLHEWAHDVGVSRVSFKPVATRETRDGTPGPDTGARILRLETLASGEGDFTADTDEWGGLAIKEGVEPITRAEAHDALGRTVLWLGPDFAGLSLTQILRTTRAEGRHSRTELFGQAAADALACGDEIRRSFHGRFVKACERMRRAKRSLEMRGNRVFATGPVVWGKPETGVRLVYGTVGDRYVMITETTDPRGLRVAGLAPPEGSLLVTGKQSGTLSVDGVYVSIGASSEELLLSAARSLGPMSLR